MRLVNCPYCKRCYGRKSSPYGYCSYCHGKRKINAAFLKWETKRHKAEAEKSQKLMEDFNIFRLKELDKFLDEFDKKHPRPNKFAKVK